MPGKVGAKWGKRDPRRQPLSGPPKELPIVADPADGRKVPRCRICGLPDQPRNQLRTGQWLGPGPLHVPVKFPLPLCDRCIAHYAPIDPQAGDPLTVTDWSEEAA